MSCDDAPILRSKCYDEPSVFAPENMLREARRQKGLPYEDVPDICVLDPDGDIVRFLQRERRAVRSPAWACYHTELLVFEQEGITFGIIGCAVGGSFAVLIAEELFASGCKLLISVTSAGQIVRVQPPPYFVLIDGALRDEGTSYHYLPSSPFAQIQPSVLQRLGGVLKEPSLRVLRGPSWTTDAPFRETEKAIGYAHEQGILAVEMESASLYAFAEARSKPVVCFAHITNQMARSHGDFEKGEAEGAVGSLRLVASVAKEWLRSEDEEWP